MWTREKHLTRERGPLCVSELRATAESKDTHMQDHQPAAGGRESVFGRFEGSDGALLPATKVICNS